MAFNMNISEDGMVLQIQRVYNDNGIIRNDNDSDTNQEETAANIGVAISVENQEINENAEQNVAAISQASSIDKSDYVTLLEQQLSKKRKLEEFHDNGDISCPICMEPWTTLGEHRLCCLKCGHLFGYSCLARWLKENKKCPHCNAKAKIREVRYLYAHNLTAVDTSDLEELRSELHTVRVSYTMISDELSNAHRRNRMAEENIKDLNQRIAVLETEKQRLMSGGQASGQYMRQTALKFHLEKNFEMVQSSNCRVFAFNEKLGHVNLSCKSMNRLYMGYGIRRIDMASGALAGFTLVHANEIRDIAIHPDRDLTLTVSFDRTVKLLNSVTNKPVQGFPVEAPLWSGCWVGDNPYNLAVGSQNGLIMLFDIRQTAGALDTFRNPIDPSPIAALASVPAGASSALPTGGFLATHFNSAYAYIPRNNIYIPKVMLLDGPFTCLRYNSKYDHALISCRPSDKTPTTRHKVFTMRSTREDQDIACNIVHEFHAGTSQHLLSRPCYVDVGNDAFVAGYQESNSTVQIWSVSSGKNIQSLATSQPIVDFGVVKSTSNDLSLAALSREKLRIYRCRQE